MSSKRWLLVSGVGLLVAGCALPSVAPAHAAMPVLTFARTSTVAPAVPPTRTASQVPTHAVPAVTCTEAADSITISIVHDNVECAHHLGTASDFSCFVEGLEETILFDTGRGP
jgi:hypothetical protein